MKKLTLGNLAEHFGGHVLGDRHIAIKSASTLEHAGKGDISFLANRKYRNLLQKTKGSAVVVGEELESPAALLVVDDPYFVFSQIVVLLTVQAVPARLS